jgi:hypothetical protein
MTILIGELSKASYVTVQFLHFAASYTVTAAYFGVKDDC